MIPALLVWVICLFEAVVVGAIAFMWGRAQGRLWGHRECADAADRAMQDALAKIDAAERRAQ